MKMQLNAFGQCKVGVQMSMLIYALAMTSLLMLLQLGSAQGQAIEFETALSPVTDSLCNAAIFARGPLGLSVVTLVFVGGIVWWLTRGRGGLIVAITALVGGIVLAAAPELLTVFATQGTCTLP